MIPAWYFISETQRLTHELRNRSRENFLIKIVKYSINIAKPYIVKSKCHQYL